MKHDVPYPFHRATYHPPPDDFEAATAPAPIKTWIPGPRNVTDGDGSYSVADAMGLMVLTVISTHRPGKYPARVFYERSWVDPDGKAFGRRRCLIKTKAAFTRMLRGYRHGFDVEDSHGQS